MSLGIYPRFERDLEGAVRQTSGEGLAANLETLDEIAEAARLTPLTAFADNRPIPEDFDGDPDELAELMGECKEWYDPSLGQIAIQALANYIKGNQQAAKRLEDPSWVIDELEELSNALGEAAKYGVKFRLEMS
jgi:hypothetical protein